MKIGSQESFWFTPPFYFVNAFLNSAAFGDEYSEQRIIGGGIRFKSPQKSKNRVKMRKAG